MAITWAQALAWRGRRHLLDPVGGEPVDGVVGRLGAVPAGSDDVAELAVRVRQRASEAGDVGRALADRRLVRTYAFRGATHLVTPEDGGAYLALRRAGRMWERASWREYYRLEPEDWPDLRAVVRDALADGPLTRSALGDAVAAHARFAHLRPSFGDGTDTLLKPLTWFGDMSFAPVRDGRTTFQRLDTNPRWVDWPDLDAAGRHPGPVRASSARGRASRGRRCRGTRGPRAGPRRRGRASRPTAGWCRGAGTSCARRARVRSSCHRTT